MLRQLKLEPPYIMSDRISLKSPKSKTKRTTMNSKENVFEKTNVSSESTFYKTAMKSDRDTEDPITDSLKYFVKNSPTINKYEFANKSTVPFNPPKDPFIKPGSILKSIHNENSFKNIQNRNKMTKSLSGSNFYNYNKKDHMTDNVRNFEDVVIELKFSVFNPIAKEIDDKWKIKSELENNINILNNRLSIAEKRFIGSKTENTFAMKETAKVELSNERTLRENNFMDMEIAMTKKRIDEMRNEIFKRDRESRQIKYQTIREESDVTYLQEETRRVGREVINFQTEKKNLRTAIVLLKKQCDQLKEKVIKEDSKKMDLISGFSTLLYKAKVGY